MALPAGPTISLSDVNSYYNTNSPESKISMSDYGVAFAAGLEAYWPTYSAVGGFAFSNFYSGTASYGSVSYTTGYITLSGYTIWGWYNNSSVGQTTGGGGSLPSYAYMALQYDVYHSQWVIYGSWTVVSGGTADGNGNYKTANGGTGSTYGTQIVTNQPSISNALTSAQLSTMLSSGFVDIETHVGSPINQDLVWTPTGFTNNGSGGTYFSTTAAGQGSTPNLTYQVYSNGGGANNGGYWDVVGAGVPVTLYVVTKN